MLVFLEVLKARGNKTFAKVPCLPKKVLLPASIETLLMFRLANDNSINCSKHSTDNDLRCKLVLIVNRDSQTNLLR